MMYMVCLDVRRMLFSKLVTDAWVSEWYAWLYTPGG